MQRGKPQSKEWDNGFHGFHGSETDSGGTTSIRAIRGKISG
jgi:hypothetical protein